MRRERRLRALRRLLTTVVMVLSLTLFSPYISGLTEYIRESIDLSAIRSSSQELMATSLDGKGALSGINPESVPGSVVKRYDFNFGETYQTAVKVTQQESGWTNSNGNKLELLDSSPKDPALAQYYRLIFVPASDSLYCYYSGERVEETQDDLLGKLSVTLAAFAHK